MIQKKSVRPGHWGIFSSDFIPEGKELFSKDEWTEDEKEGWTMLTVEEILELSPDRQELYLHFSYDLDFGCTIGTFDWKYARHVSNFMNHSCNPNMAYGPHDTIVASRDILPMEELTIDYGTFIVNFDQPFQCGCGVENCRHSILAEDWKKLAPLYGEQFPEFIVKRLRKNLLVG